MAGGSPSAMAGEAIVALMTFPGIDRKIRIQAITSALTGRDWSLATGSPPATHAILVTAGRGHLVRPQDTFELAAPSLVWVPPRTAERLHLRAGASGHILGVADDLIDGIMASDAEALALRQIAGQFLAAVVTDGDRIADLRHSFAAIARELARAEPGSWTGIGAHVALILVGLWRASGVEAVAGGSRGAASAILQRFRALVEMNFRDHWPIPRYAAALAVSTDRLHAICVRELDRSPLKLVHERLVREAMVLLDRSMLTVEQISDHLGFKDPAHFNRFFKAKTGKPPGLFRTTLARESARRDGRRAIHSYADWP